jgi:antitoxin HicB
MTIPFYPIVIVELSTDDGGGFAAYAPDLYGCMSDGETPEEAVSNIQDAIVEWCAEMARLGRQIPPPGTAARDTADARQTVVDLLRKQDELLQTQAKQNHQLRVELDKLSERIAAILNEDDRPEDARIYEWVAVSARVRRLASDPGIH